MHSWAERGLRWVTVLMALTDGRAAVSLYPERRPVNHPMIVWREIAALLAGHGDGGLATAIQQAMNGGRLGTTRPSR